MEAIGISKDRPNSETRGRLAPPGSLQDEPGNLVSHSGVLSKPAQPSNWFFHLIRDRIVYDADHGPAFDRVPDAEQRIDIDSVSTVFVGAQELGFFTPVPAQC
jgi:hypothetical protein